MCSSGDSTDQGAENSSAAFQNTLQNSFNTQFGENQAVTNLLTNTLTNQLTNPQGYTPAQLAAQRTSATDTIANQYQDAQKALQNKQFAAGGESLPSGVNAQQTGALAIGQATDTANAQNQITQANANLQQQNYWNAVQGLMGVNSNNNANQTATDANGAGSTTASLSNAYSNSEMASNSPLNSLIGAVGGAASGLAGAAGKAGSFGALFA